MSTISYLPKITQENLEKLLSKDENFNLEHFLAQYQYERLGLDRLFLILSDIHKKDRTEALFLDVGCNNGLLPLMLGLLGYSAVGIDNSVINSQQVYSPLSFSKISPGMNVRFYACDLIQYITEQRHQRFDYVLLLSVMHHWQSGYPMNGNIMYCHSEIHTILAELFKRTERAVYFEIPTNEPGFVQGWDINFIQNFLSDKLSVSFLSETIGPNGYIRHLYKGIPLEISSIVS